MKDARPQPLIEAPQLMSRRTRARDTLLTAFMWGLYAYLWLPVISLFAWYIGLDYTYEIMVRAGGAEAFREVMIWYQLVAGLIIIFVAGWSVYQRIRFRGHERRQFAPVISDEELMAAYEIDADAFRSLRHARRVVVSLGADGKMQSIRESAAGAG